MRINFLIALSLVFNCSLISQTWHEQQAFRTPGDSVKQLGTEMAAHDGKLLVVTDSSVVYLVSDQNDNWIHKQTIDIWSTHGGSPTSVALYKNLAVISSAMDDTDVNGNNPITGAGAAYIYKYQNNKWQFFQKIVSSQRGVSHIFGSSIAIDSNTIAVGEYRRTSSNGINEGAAYIFTLDTNGFWQEIQKITPSFSSKERGFGISMVLKPDMLFIGAPLESIGGAVYFYKFENNQWVLKQKIYDNTLYGHEFFGASIARQQNTLVIGAPKHDNPNSGSFIKESGAAYIYEYNGKLWMYKQTLAAIDTTSYSDFGLSLTIKDNAIAIGSSKNEKNSALTDSIYRAGAAYIFMNTSGTWSQTQKLTPSWRIDLGLFGYKVVQYKNQFIFSAPLEAGINPPTNGLHGGSLYIFERPSAIGIKESFSEPFQVYPNPTKGLLNISGLNSINKEITLTNIWGAHYNFKTENNTIDLSNMKPGLYFIRIESQTIKVIVK